MARKSPATRAHDFRRREAWLAARNKPGGDNVAGQDQEDEVKRDPPSDTETCVQGHMSTDPVSSSGPGVSVAREGEVSGLVTSGQTVAPAAAVTNISSNSMETDSEEICEDKAVLDMRIKALNREHATGNIYLNLIKEDNSDESDDRFLGKDINIDFKRQVEDGVYLFQVTLEKINIADMELLVTLQKPYYSNAFDSDCNIKESPRCDCGSLIDFKWTS